MIGDEPHAPYDRPPLSKQYLAGDWDGDRLALTKPDRFAGLDLDFRPSTRAVSFSLAERTLITSGPDGERSETVDGLLIATGARCRTLPGTEGMAGVFVLRSLDDASALRQAFEATPGRVVVVGAGFIGAEVAATARGFGLEVTMVEALPTPLARVLGEQMGRLAAEVHKDHGVDLRTGVGVASIDGGDRVESVTLSDGSVLLADVVVVGIGVIPNVEWLQGSGLHVDNGVVCDPGCLAGPAVTAAGDVARWANPRFCGPGETMRVEHWDNAAQQGAFAARRLLSGDAGVGDTRAGDTPDPEAGDPYSGAFAPIPWFWSDQYELKIQLAGSVRPDDRVEIVAGSPEERRLAALYGRDDHLVGVLGFNRPRHVMKYRGLIERGVSFSEALAAEV